MSLRRWKLCVAIFLLTLTPGVLWVLNELRPIYSAEVTLLVPPGLANQGSGSDSDLTYASFTNQQIMVILEYRTLSAAVQQLLKQQVIKRSPGETEQQVVDRFRDTLDVHRIPDSFEIVVKARDLDPRAAATSANAVTKVFLDQTEQPGEFSLLNPGESLVAEKKRVDEDLKQRLAERAKLAQKLQIVDLGSNSNSPVDLVIMNLRDALATASRRRIDSDERLRSARSTAEIDAAEIARSQPATAVLTSELTSRRIELERRIQNLLPGNPIRIQAEAQLQAINLAMQGDPSGQAVKILAGLLGKLEAENRQARSVESELKRKLAQATAGIENQSLDLARAQMLNQTISRLEDEANRLDSQVRRINPQNTTSEGIRVLSVAEPASGPERSRRTWLLLVFGGAAVISLMVSLCVELIDTKLHDAASVERALGIPLLGMTVRRTAKTETFADEYIRRLAVGIERELAQGARTILLVGLKSPTPLNFVRDISQHLNNDGFSLTVCVDGQQIETKPKAEDGLTGDQVSLLDKENRNVFIMNAEPIIFSAETERLAGEVDVTLLIAEASVDKRDDLVRSAEMLANAKVRAFGVILRDVRINRASRLLRKDWLQFGVTGKRAPQLSSRKGRLSSIV